MGPHLIRPLIIGPNSSMYFEVELNGAHVKWPLNCSISDKRFLYVFSEDLKTFLSSETLRLGVFRVFNMFQHQRLNKRLVYVILEGMLETLFTDNKFPEVFRKLHSRSQRVKKEGAKLEKIPITRKKVR